MSIWFVSRHPGAVSWAKNKNIKVDHWVAHFSAEDIVAGDTVIGILPVNLAAAVCACGARYLNLSLDLPYTLRGKELNEAGLIKAGAKLEEFMIIARGNSNDKV